jgi:rfaE bifunctional protein nucleotidyltransferase chain/domain
MDKVLYSYNELKNIVAKLKEQSKRPIVFGNGCFDMFHYGHLDYLNQAAAHGNLVIGVNSDASVRKLDKSINRPIIPDYQRAAIVAAISCVKAVIIFDEQIPQELVRVVQPDIIVKGLEYNLNELKDMGLNCSVDHTIDYIQIERIPNISTSEIINKAWMSINPKPAVGKS